MVGTCIPKQQRRCAMTDKSDMPLDLRIACCNQGSIVSMPTAGNVSQAHTESVRHTGRLRLLPESRTKALPLVGTAGASRLGWNRVQACKHQEQAGSKAGARDTPPSVSCCGMGNWPCPWTLLSGRGTQWIAVGHLCLDGWDSGLQHVAAWGRSVSPRPVDVQPFS